MQQKMSIQDYEVWVNLGCSDEEKTHKQPILFNLEIFFSQDLPACKTDQLEDAVDYVKLTSILKVIATSKSFNLIEHLNLLAFNGVVEYLKSKDIKGDVKLSIKKVRVPVDYLRNGVVFSCETSL